MYRTQLTQMLILAQHHNPVGHIHLEFIVEVPRRNTIAVGQKFVVVKKFTIGPNSLGNAHLFADVVRIGRRLDNWVVVIAVRGR